MPACVVSMRMMAERAQVDARAVALDHARVLELAHALAHGRLRQADALAQRREALARVGLQGFEDQAVFLVDVHAMRRGGTDGPSAGSADFR